MSCVVRFDEIACILRALNTSPFFHDMHIVYCPRSLRRQKPSHSWVIRKIIEHDVGLILYKLLHCTAPVNLIAIELQLPREERQQSCEQNSIASIPVPATGQFVHTVFAMPPQHQAYYLLWAARHKYIFLVCCTHQRVF